MAKRSLKPSFYTLSTEIIFWPTVPLVVQNSVQLLWETIWRKQFEISALQISKMASNHRPLWRNSQGTGSHLCSASSSPLSISPSQNFAFMKFSCLVEVRIQECHCAVDLIIVYFFRICISSLLSVRKNHDASAIWNQMCAHLRRIQSYVAATTLSLTSITLRTGRSYNSHNISMRMSVLANVKCPT